MGPRAGEEPRYPGAQAAHRRARERAHAEPQRFLVVAQGVYDDVGVLGRVEVDAGRAGPARVIVELEAAAEVRPIPGAKAARLTTIFVPEQIRAAGHRRGRRVHLGVPVDLIGHAHVPPCGAAGAGGQQPLDPGRRLAREPERRPGAPGRRQRLGDLRLERRVLALDAVKVPRPARRQSAGRGGAEPRRRGRQAVDEHAGAGVLAARAAVSLLGGDRVGEQQGAVDTHRRDAAKDVRGALRIPPRVETRHQVVREGPVVGVGERRVRPGSGARRRRERERGSCQHEDGEDKPDHGQSLFGLVARGIRRNPRLEPDFHGSWRQASSGASRDSSAWRESAPAIRSTSWPSRSTTSKGIDARVEAGADSGILVDVDLDHLDLTGVVGGEALEYRGDHLARNAPRRPQVDDYGDRSLRLLVERRGVRRHQPGDQFVAAAAARNPASDRPDAVAGRTRRAAELGHDPSVGPGGGRGNRDFPGIRLRAHPDAAGPRRWLAMSDQIGGDPCPHLSLSRTRRSGSPLTRSRLSWPRGYASSATRSTSAQPPRSARWRPTVPWSLAARSTRAAGTATPDASLPGIATNSGVSRSRSSRWGR